MRRVVTGHDASGKSVVLSDAPPPVVREIPEDGAAFYEIWSTDESPAPVAPDEPDPTNSPTSSRRFCPRTSAPS
jgi:hypothetical protein